MERFQVPPEEGIDSPNKPHYTKAQLDLINSRRQPTSSTPQNLFSLPLDSRLDRSPNILNSSGYLNYNFPSLHDHISSLAPLGSITPKQLDLFKGGGLTPSNLDLFQGGGLTPGGLQKYNEGFGTPHAMNLLGGNTSPSPNLLSRFQMSNQFLKQQHQLNLETVRNLLNAGGGESIQNSPFHHASMGLQHHPYSQSSYREPGSTP